MDSNEVIYLAIEGDTLQSISDKFEIPVNWLKECNHLYNKTVFPGDRIKIIPPPQTIDIPPINVEIFGEEDNSKGVIKIINYNIHFVPRWSKKTFIINLIGHLESAVMPHPQSMMMEDPDLISKEDILSLLVISYLEKPNDKKSMKTKMFAGKKSDLTKLQITILCCATTLQNQNAFLPPDPNSIPFNSKLEPENNDNLTRRRTSFQLPPIKFNGKSEILNEDEFNLIRNNLPSRIKTLDFNLLFQLSKDGCSYSTFFEKTSNINPVLFILLNDKNEKIGSYVSLGFKISRNFYV